MRVSRSGVWAVLLLVLAVPFQWAQNAPTTPPEQSSPQTPAPSAQAQPTPPTVHHGRQIPCWRLAGIDPAMMNQRWQIEDNAKGKIGAVCSDDSLTPEKKIDKIHQIDAQSDQEIAKLIPATQFDAFKACQADRDREKASRPGRTPQKELGPCGGVIPGPSGTTPQSHQHSPSSPSSR